VIAWSTLGWVWIGSAIAMTLVWAYSRHVRNAGYVDVAWAALMGAMGVCVAALGRGAVLPRALVGALVAAWGLRLFLHLYARVHGHAEDARYANLRAHWNGDERKFLLFFQAQAVIVTLFAIPLVVAAANPVPGPTAWTIAGVATWIVAVGGESLADRQLAAWIADPAHRGRSCRSGLWAWSRHPNYFFEWVHWFAYALLAVGAPMGWLAWLGPALMFAFLYRLTGIPYNEAQSLRQLGDDYRAYQREVSAFFPWPPRRTG